MPTGTELIDLFTNLNMLMRFAPGLYWDRQR
jgi:hypothetical protein